MVLEQLGQGVFVPRLRPPLQIRMFTWFGGHDDSHKTITGRGGRLRTRKLPAASILPCAAKEPAMCRSSRALESRSVSVCEAVVLGARSSAGGSLLDRFHPAVLHLVPGLQAPADLL